MNCSSGKVFIIKPYNKYIPPAENEVIRQVFKHNEWWYCIAEVQLDWGTPVVARPIEEQDEFGYRIYNTFEEARDFVQRIRGIK